MDINEEQNYLFIFLSIAELAYICKNSSFPCKLWIIFWWIFDGSDTVSVFRLNTISKNLSILSDITYQN